MRRPRRWAAGGFVHPSLPYWPQRDDQGCDGETRLGHHLTAPGHGEVIAHSHDQPFPNGFGDPYPIVRFDTGRFAGVGPMYLGHCNADVLPVGHRFRQGDRLVKLTNSLNTGRGWFEIGRWINGGPAPNGDGANIRHLFKPAWRWT